MMNQAIIGETGTQIREKRSAVLKANPNPELPWKKMIGMRSG